ncbi:hypothetical protein BH23BAC3_BH23BAC3_06140 [soil metagenome]
MHKRLLLVTIFTFAITSFAFGQLFEDFEGGVKGSYASGTVNLETGTWLLDAALLGNQDGDQRNGNQSVRLDNRSRQATLQMNFNFPDGADEVRFYLAKSNFSGDQSADASVMVQYSQDNGTSWNDLEEVVAPSALQELSVQAGVQGPVRFRILTTSGNRLNLDDFYIEPFIEIQDDPTILVRRGNDTVEEGSELSFQTTSVGTSRSINLEIRNNGEPDLEISAVTLQEGAAFTVDSDIMGSIETGETSTLTISFSPQSVDSFTDQLSISSNDPETPNYTLNLSGSALSEDEVSPIADARELEFGTRVTVAGRVTVANEFEGPVFLQDETAGIAVYYVPLHTAVQRGDSVIVTGPVTEFNPTGSNQGTFLRQIAAHDGDSEITFEVVDTEPVEVQPQIITLAEMNGGDYESQLITVGAVSFLQGGVFQGGTNYTITDPTDNADLRIDQNATDLVNASIPEDVIEVTGVVDRFSGTYQLKPRDNNDIAVDIYEPVGDDIPKDQTFDVVTWNIEWFGDASSGPDDLDLQMNNVIEVITTIDADLYALQEIADETRFFALVDSLEDYSGFWADYITQNQKMAYLFRTAVIDSIDSGALIAGQQSFHWAGRLPQFFEFDATVNGITRRINSYNVHAKAFGDEDSYNRRQQASLSLKTYFDNYKENENVLFLGDYNDMLTQSSFNGADSPFKNFIDDGNYLTITKSLEERGFASFIAGQFRSMIDHITVSNDLIDDHIDGAERVENPNYIGSYISTTSDHAPVWTRFDFSRSLVSTKDEILTEAPETYELNQNYPNPFNPTTNISFSLPGRAEVSLQVYDVMGREVAILANRQTFTGGRHTLAFDASNLASGMYIYRMTIDNGMALSRKMMVVK